MTGTNIPIFIRKKKILVKNWSGIRIFWNSAKIPVRIPNQAKEGVGNPNLQIKILPEEKVGGIPNFKRGGENPNLQKEQFTRLFFFCMPTIHSGVVIPKTKCT